MMNDIQLSSADHDLLIEDSDIKLFSSLQGLTVQKVKLNLLNFRGEWFRDIDTGIPYVQDIFGKRNTKEVADTLIKNTILATTGISSLIDYTSSITTDRKLQVVFSAKTERGVLTGITVEI